MNYLNRVNSLKRNIIFNLTKSITYAKKPKEITTYKYRRYDNIQQKERLEFFQKFKETRKEMLDQYWKDQAIIEEEFKTELQYKQKNEINKNRQVYLSFVINQSFRCRKEMKWRKDLHLKFEAKKRVWQLEEDELNKEKQALLNILDQQSENWLTPTNFDKKINSVLDEILPTTLISHKDFYNKLNKYALLLDQGDIKAAEQLKYSEEHSEFKNSLLKPLYKNLIKMIKIFSRPKQFEIHNHHYTQKILNPEKIEEIKNSYNQQVKKLNNYDNTPIGKLENIEFQLKFILNMLITWNKYVEILYLTDEEISKNLKKSLEQDKEIEKINLDEEIFWNEEMDSTNTDLNSFVKKQKKNYLNSILDSSKKDSFLNLISQEKDDLKLNENKEEPKKSKKTKSTISEKKFDLLETEVFKSESDLDFNLDDATYLMDSFDFNDENQEKKKDKPSEELNSYLNKLDLKSNVNSKVNTNVEFFNKNIYYETGNLLI